jgi:hypothetical protein
MEDENAAAVPTLKAARRRTRPGWVWVISIWYAISVPWELFSLYMLWSGSVPLAQKAYFGEWTFFDYALSVILTLLTLSAALVLFLLRKQAVALFSIALAWNITASVWRMATKGWITGTILLSVISSCGILIAVCIYSRRLAKVGVLT